MQTRRQFIVKGGKLVAVGAAASAVGPTIFVRDARAAGQLKILQWSHFVPAYDKWFDPFAKEWGAKRGVEVTVDHVGFADVVPRATAEVAAQAGHDIHMFLGLASAFEEHVIDLADVTGALEKIWQAGVPAVEIFCARQHLDYRDRAQVTELGHWFRDGDLKLHSLHAPMYNDDIWGRSGPHAVVTGRTTLGARNRIFQFALAVLQLVLQESDL